MNITRKLLTHAAQKLEMPPDIFARLPRIEVLGAVEFSVEPHGGLKEYSEDRITIMTAIGPVSILGKGLTIRHMSTGRITLSGILHQLILPEDQGE